MNVHYATKLQLFVLEMRNFIAANKLASPGSPSTLITEEHELVSFDSIKRIPVFKYG